MVKYTLEEIMYGEKYNIESDVFMAAYELAKQRIKLTDAQSASYKYADLFAESVGSDGKLKLSKISYTKFEEVCKKEYYGSRLYFRIKYQGEKLLEASLFLDYYLAG